LPALLADIETTIHKFIVIPRSKQAGVSCSADEALIIGFARLLYPQHLPSQKKARPGLTKKGRHFSGVPFRTLRARPLLRPESRIRKLAFNKPKR
jgi:hypothetical protein